MRAIGCFDQEYTVTMKDESACTKALRLNDSPIHAYERKKKTGEDLKDFCAAFTQSIHST